MYVNVLFIICLSNINVCLLLENKKQHSTRYADCIQPEFVHMPIKLISSLLKTFESIKLFRFFFCLAIAIIWECFLVFLLLSMYKIIILKNSFEMPYNTQAASKLKTEFPLNTSIYRLQFEIRMAIGVILTAI